MNWKNLLRLIGLGLLAWIMTTINWSQIARMSHAVNPYYLASYVMVFIGMIMLRTTRLWLTLHRLGYRISWSDCYVALLEPAFMGGVTPGRLGEFSRVAYLRSHGVPLQDAAAVVTLERIIDASTMLVIGAGGLVYIFAPSAFRPLTLIVLVAGLSLIFASIRYQAISFRFIKQRLSWLTRWEPRTVRQHRVGLSTALQLVLQKAGLLMFGLSLLCISCSFTQIFLLTKAMRFHADYLVVGFAYATAALVSLLPISVGGLGTREATYIFIMAREGITREQALLFSLIDGVILGVFGLLLLVLPIWILRSMRRAKRRSS